MTIGHVAGFDPQTNGLDFISNPGVPLDLQHSTGEPTRAFIVTSYSPVDPGPLFAASAPRFAWLGVIARIFRRLFGAPA